MVDTKLNLLLEGVLLIGHSKVCTEVLFHYVFLVCFITLLSDLNELHLWVTEIGNAYLKAYTSENSKDISWSSSRLSMIWEALVNTGIIVLPLFSKKWDFFRARPIQMYGWEIKVIAMIILKSILVTLKLL